MKQYSYSSKGNKYFLKDKKAQIYKRIMNGTNPGGYPYPPTYYPIATAPIWCYAKQLSQSDIYKAMAIGVDESRLFVFNYYPNVDVFDIVQYKGKWYEITRVDTTDDYKSDLFVYVQNAKSGNIPKDNQIKPYTPGIWDVSGKSDD